MDLVWWQMEDQMRIDFKVLTVTIASLFSVAALASVELPIKGVYAPSVGYDDNDPIVVTIDTELPNSCYLQSLSQAIVNAEQRAIKVHQFADRTRDGVCAANDESLPVQIRNPIAIVTEAVVGTLREGDYRFEYSSSTGPLTRALHVDHAAASTIDNVSYATVTNAFAPAFVSATEATFEVRLTGTLSSSCTEVFEVKTTFVDDVLIVLPKVRQTSDFCMPAVRPFYRIINVETPTRGKYLLHARSQGGTSKSMLFEVSTEVH